MSVQKLNIQVDQGTDFTETIVAKTSTGSIIDLSGYTVAGQIRKTYDSSTSTPFTAGFGVRTAGEVTIELARSVTSSLEAGRYVYDVEITSGADKRTRLVQGQVTVTQEVTRAGPIDYIDEVNITDPVDGSILVYDNATSKWIDDATIKRVDTDNVTIAANVDVTGIVEADGFSGTGALTITDFIDDDSFGTATATNVPTAESVRAYVDAKSETKDTIGEMGDTNITSPVSAQFLIYDGTNSWDNKSITGDVTFTAGGVSAISSGAIINADIKSDAAISISKTALIAGTGIDLDENTIELSDGAALDNLTGGSSTTTFLRNDGAWATPVDTTYTNGTGLTLDVTEFSISAGAALTNLGGDGTDYSALEDNIPLFHTFLRKDGAWSSVKQYSGGVGVNVIASANVALNDTITLSAGAALGNLGGQVGDDTSLVLSKDGSWVVPPDNNTEYTAGTGVDLNSLEFSLSAGAALTNLGGAADQDAELVLNRIGGWSRPPTYVLANTGLTFVANSTAQTADHASFAVNASLTHLTAVGSSATSTDFVGDTLTLDGASAHHAITATTITANSDVIVHGNLTVNGTETVVNSTTLSVDDKNIVLGSVDTPTDTTADGGGITLKGTTDKTINWVDSTDSWTSSENFELASAKAFRINANEVLNQTTLGSTVLASSLTSVGTIGTGTWQGTAIGNDYIANIGADKLTTGTLSSNRLSGSYTGITGIGTIPSLDVLPPSGTAGNFTHVSRGGNANFILSGVGAVGDAGYVAPGQWSVSGAASATILAPSIDLVGALGVKGATTVAGALGVTGDSTLVGALGVKGATTVAGTVGITGDSTLVGALGVTGDSTLVGALGVKGDSTLTGALGVTGDSTLTGATTVNGLLTVNNDTLQLTSTTASSGTENPALELYRNGGSGSGQLGAVKFFGNNNAGTPEKFEYAGIYADVQVATDGSEQGSLKFSLGTGGAQEDPAMSLFSYGLQMGYGNPILMSYSNGYQQFFSPNAAQKSFKLNATPNATVDNGAYDIYLPDVAGGTLVAANSDKAFTAGAGSFSSIQSNMKTTLVTAATLAVTKAAHSGSKIIFTGTSASAFTFPAVVAGDVADTYMLVNAGTATITCGPTGSDKFVKLVLGNNPAEVSSIALTKGGIAEFAVTAAGKITVFGSGIT